MQLQTFFISTLSAYLFFSHHALHPLIFIFIARFWSRQKTMQTQQLVRQIVTGQSIFVLLYCIWLEFFGQMMIDYLPILIFAILVLQDIHEQNNLVSISQKNRQVKQSLLYLLNNVQMYVLVYNILELIFNFDSTPLFKVGLLLYMLKFKYGFNMYMQNIFGNTNQAIVEVLKDKGVLLRGYLFFTGILGKFAKVYVPGHRRATVVKKNV